MENGTNPAARSEAESGLASERPHPHLPRGTGRICTPFSRRLPPVPLGFRIDHHHGRTPYKLCNLTDRASGLFKKPAINHEDGVNRRPAPVAS